MRNINFDLCNLTFALCIIDGWVGEGHLIEFKIDLPPKNKYI